MISEVKNNQITKEQKRAFYQFVIDMYTLPSFVIHSNYNIPTYTNFKTLNKYGFCLLIYHYFGVSVYADVIKLKKLFPELYAFMPETEFYDSDNNKTDEKSQFWFPVCGNQTERIRIAEQILKEL